MGTIRILFVALLLVVFTFGFRVLWKTHVRQAGHSALKWAFAVFLTVGWGLGLVGLALPRFVPIQSQSDTLRALSYTGLLAVGVLFVLCLVTGVVYGPHWARLLWQRLRKTTPPTEASLPHPRRAFFRSLAGGTVLAGSAGLSAWGVRNALGGFVYKDIDVPIKDLPSELEGFTLAQITDVHIGHVVEKDYLQRVVSAVNDLNADAICITGDLVDGYPAELGPNMSALSQLKAPLGVHYVTGNHEYYWDQPGWVSLFKGLGLNVLENAHVVLESKGHKILLAGVVDYSRNRVVGKGTSSPRDAVQGAPTDTALRILMAHQPASIWDAEGLGFHLQISGHTHGGQMFPIGLFVRFSQPYVTGLHTHGDGTQVYVSEGTGYWGPPMRIGTRSEITRIRFLRAV